MDYSWDILAHQTSSGLPSCYWSLLEPQHCKHCWFHQMQQRCQEEHPGLDYKCPSIRERQVTSAISIRCLNSEQMAYDMVSRRTIVLAVQFTDNMMAHFDFVHLT